MDWELIYRFRRCGARFLLLPFFLGHFRLHADQKTQSSIKAGVKEMELVRGKFLARSEHTFVGFYSARLFQIIALGCYLITGHAQSLLYRAKTFNVR